jgi:predicted secreted protein/putative hemolysin
MTAEVRTGRSLPGIIALGIVLALLAFAAGCTQQAATPATTMQAPAGMANPASVACGEAGGVTEIKTDATGGQYGMCNFPNGTSCEEWALYRGEGCKPGSDSPAGEKKMVTFTDADKGSTVTVTEGTKFAVELAENPTTGFQWQATLSPGLELVSDDYQVDAHAEGMVGVGGTRTWIILAKESGDQTFSATYKRSWETATGSETAYSLTINVEKA